jgi:diguanylate cyclase
MTDKSNASEVARETLRRLAMRRLAPTPDNYRALFHEIAGTSDEDVFPEKSLKYIAAALPRDSAWRERLAHEFEHAVATGQWPSVRNAVLALAAAPAEPPEWGPLLRTLMAELDRQHDALPTAKKREVLNQLLGNGAAADSEVLFQRLSKLAHTWERAAAGTAVAPPIDCPAPAAADCNGLQQSPFAALLGRLLEQSIPALIENAPGISDEARALARDLAAGGIAPETIGERLDDLMRRLDWVGEDQRSVRDALIGLFRLIVDNISRLVADDRWLTGQLALINEAMSGTLEIRVLDEVAMRLRQVIEKQDELKREMGEAQSRLKEMLAGFVDRLSRFADSTGSYHDTLDGCAKRISEASSVIELSSVVEDILRETRSAQDNALETREELMELRSRVEHADLRITELQHELDETSRLVRHDSLTGSLNRKGLDETLAREIATARRRGTPLCLALLDIDNFKHVNDTFGHKTGDDALVHLAQVIRQGLRPLDSLGRYGGEEFLIVLPDTKMPQAESVLTRLQRDLTKHYFMAGQQKILITFSAGVAQMHDNEDHHGAIERADKAMYAAKRAGKNRVFAA